MEIEGLIPVEQKRVVDTRTLQQEPFPEDPQARFEAIFAAIGNSEAKCATLLSLPSNHPLTAIELHTAFLDSTDGAWKTNPRIQAEYCDATFIPIGFVAKTEVLHYGKMNFVKGYRITEAGIKYGQPIAKYLLEKSSSLPYSLDAIFGPTARGGGGQNRGVLTRAAILESLYAQANETSSTTSNAHFSRELGRDGSVFRKHMVVLRDLGLVEYDSINTEEPGAINYRFIDSEGRIQPSPVRRWPTLTTTVYEVIRDLRVSDIGRVLQECKRRLPNASFDHLRVNQILSGLALQGILDSDFKGSGKGQVFSKSKITDAGKKIVEEIILPIKAALSSEGEERLQEWNNIPWQIYAPDAVEKYASSSSGANSRPIQEWAAYALQMIIDNPGIRTTEIGSKLKTNIGIVLKLLLDEGVVRRERNGKASRFYSVDYETPSPALNSPVVL